MYSVGRQLLRLNKGIEMALTRADVISQEIKKVETYSDISTNFIRHPITNELVTVKNEDSVRQALKNLILTSIGEKPFNPYFGSNINKSLFEQFTPFLQEDILRYINLAVSQFEPRVNLLNVAIEDSPDNNGYSINIVFSLINKPEPINLSLLIKRVR